jgi:hypothetical protein
MTTDAERRLLQIAVAFAASVPLTAGGLGMVASADMLAGVAAPLAIDLDSHFRYLSGLLFGIGAAFVIAIPAIERHAFLFRTLGAIIVIGGLARLFGAVAVGMPGPGHVFGLVMELVTVPLIVLWQRRVARRFAGPK